MSSLTYADYLRMESLLLRSRSRGPHTRPAVRSSWPSSSSSSPTKQSCELWLKQLGSSYAAAEALLPPCDTHDLELGLEFLLLVRPVDT